MRTKAPSELLYIDNDGRRAGRSRKEHSSGGWGAVSDRQPDRQHADILIAHAWVIRARTSRVGTDGRCERPYTDSHLHFYRHPHPGLFRHLAARGAGRWRADRNFDWLG